MIIAFLRTLSFVLSVLNFFVVIYVITNWLLFFDIISRNNKFFYAIHEGITQLLEPLLQRLRAILPRFSQLDLSPLVLIVIIYFLNELIAQSFLAIFASNNAASHMTLSPLK